jgi:hypothetical protein
VCKRVFRAFRNLVRKVNYEIPDTTPPWGCVSSSSGGCPLIAAMPVTGTAHILIQFVCSHPTLWHLVTPHRCHSWHPPDGFDSRIALA